MPPFPANFFVFLVEMGFHHVGLAGLELLTSGDPSTLAPQNAGMTGLSHYAWLFYKNKMLWVQLNLPYVSPQPFLSCLFQS